MATIVSGQAAGQDSRSFRQSLLAMLGLCCIVMMVGLDQTVVGSALPTIVADLDGFSLYAWVGTSYMLTCVIAIPIFGRLGDYHGRRSFVLTGIVLFCAAALGCGLAQSLPQLIIGRGIQGAAAGMLIATAFASVPDLFPEMRVRLRWQVMFSSAYGVACVVGPVLGGVLTEQLGWRSVFLVHVPTSVGGWWLVWRFLPRIRSAHNGPAPLDWQGALLIVLCLAALQMFVGLAPAQGVSWLVLVLGAGSLAALLALIGWERLSPAPIIPLELFRDRSLAVLFSLSCMLGFGMFILLFYVPLLFQGGLGLSPQTAGFLITPLVVCISVGSITNSQIVTRLPNPAVMLWLGFILLLLCSVGSLTITQATSRHMLMIYMALGGLGLGLLMPNLTVFVQEIAGRGHLGIVTALQQSLRMIGGMVGMAVAGSLMEHVYARRIGAALARVVPADHLTDGWISTASDPQLAFNPVLQQKLLEQVAPQGLDAHTYIELARGALMIAVQSSLWIVCASAVVGFFWVFRLPRVVLGRPPA